MGTAGDLERWATNEVASWWLSSAPSDMVEAAIRSPEGRIVAIADSQGRFAILDRAKPVPYPVSENVRSWPYFWRDE